MQTLPWMWTGNQTSQVLAAREVNLYQHLKRNLLCSWTPDMVCLTSPLHAAWDLELWGILMWGVGGRGGEKQRRAKLVSCWKPNQIQDTWRESLVLHWVTTTNQPIAYSWPSTSQYMYTYVQLCNSTLWAAVYVHVRIANTYQCTPVLLVGCIMTV